MAADRAALESVNDAWGKVYNAADAGGLTALYREDAAVNPPGAPQVRWLIVRDTWNSDRAPAPPPAAAESVK